LDIVIAGAGGVGSYLVERLVVENHSITLIDSNEDILGRISAQHDIRAVEGSATALSTLKRANVAEADIFIAATSSDESNLIACLLAHSLNSKQRKIARIQSFEGDGAWLSRDIASIFDEFINPHLEAASTLAKLFQVPGACEVLDMAGDQVRVVGITLRKEAKVLGKPLRELNLGGEEQRIVVAAIIRNDQLIVPSGDDSLEAGDLVYVVTQPGKTDELFARAGIPQDEIKRVMIWGGTPIGKMLAQSLLEEELQVKILDVDEARCAELAEELDGVVVLQGEGKDQALLLEEGIEDTDVFVSVTDDEEDNILSALLARKLGAKSVAVTVNQMSYVGLVSTIGIDIVINPRISAGSSILKHVRGGRVSSAFSIRDDSAEVIELIATEESKIAGKSLKDMKLPGGVIVGAIVRDSDVTIPTGATIVGLGDRLIVFAHRSSLPKLEKLLGAPLEVF